MESKSNFFFNKQTIGGVIVGACITLLAVEILEDRTDCSVSPDVYNDWYNNYNNNPSCAITALKVHDTSYNIAKKNYRRSLSQPLDGAYGGRLDLKFLSSYLCQAQSDGADSIYFNIGKAPNPQDAAKVYLFSNSPSGNTKQVMTFSKVSGCPPNCRGGDLAR